MRLKQTALKIIILVSLCLPFAAFSQAIKLSELFNALSQVKTDHKRFIEQQFDPLLEISQTQFGVMYYRSPSLLEQHYEKPVVGTITFSPTLIKLNFPNRKQELPVESFPEISLFSQTFLNLLNGNLALLQKNFALEFKTSENQGWQLNLTPTNQLKKYVQAIQILGSQTEIRSILLTKTSGDWRKITLQPIPVKTAIVE